MPSWFVLCECSCSESSISFVKLWSSARDYASQECRARSCPGVLAALAHHHRPGRALDFVVAGLIASSTPFLGCIPKLQSQLFSTRRRASHRRLLACCHLVRQGLMRTTIWLERFHRCLCQRLRGLLLWMRVYLCGHISWASPHQGLASNALSL